MWLHRQITISWIALMHAWPACARVHRLRAPWPSCLVWAQLAGWLVCSRDAQDAGCRARSLRLMKREQGPTGRQGSAAACRCLAAARGSSAPGGVDAKLSGAPNLHRTCAWCLKQPCRWGEGPCSLGSACRVSPVNKGRPVLGQSLIWRTRATRKGAHRLRPPGRQPQGRSPGPASRQGY